MKARMAPELISREYKSSGMNKVEFQKQKTLKELDILFSPEGWIPLKPFLEVNGKEKWEEKSYLQNHCMRYLGNRGTRLEFIQMYYQCFGHQLKHNKKDKILTYERFKKMRKDKGLDPIIVPGFKEEKSED